MSVSVLLVEDKERTRQQILAELAPLKLSVTIAKDGLDGLRQAQLTVFDMVLTDHKMPVMDGFALLKNLRGMASYQQTPLFLMSTQDIVEVEPKAIAAGATCCFSKPLEGPLLRQVLAANMKRSVA